jgi:hypothetical protein
MDMDASLARAVAAFGLRAATRSVSGRLAAELFHSAQQLFLRKGLG